MCSHYVFILHVVFFLSGKGMALLSIAIPVRIPMKQNATHDYIVLLGSIKLHLCFSAMWELVGWGHTSTMNKFVSNFIYNNKLADNPNHPQAYMGHMPSTWMPSSYRSRLALIEDVC
jgi:hypothetical protein